MKNSIAYTKASEFAIDIYKYSAWLKNEKKEFDLARQILKSGTSIGANLAEANGAISKNDFSNKVGIAYKESLETQFWLDLLTNIELIDNIKFELLMNKADELSRILFSILKTTRITDH